MSNSTAPIWLTGGGEMGERMRALDWSSTPLGPIDGWPQSLRSALSIMLPSKAQICLFWGPDLVTIYNDAYAPVLGLKHPWALGRPGREVWSELWDVLRPLFEGVLRTGEAFWAANHPFTMERNGFSEETFFDISYDPVRDESGAVGGLFCIVTETTGRVVGERRLALLRDLAERNATARTTREACALAMQTLAGRPDVPFARVYLGEELQAATPGGEAQPGLAREIPIPGGRLLAGLNAQRPFDEQYAAFLDLVASQIATAIANAQAYEEEKKRAEALAELDRAKTAFFSNVSHEFRTPLTLMLGPLEDSLADEANPMTPRQRERLELMRRNGVRLKRLVNTLLDFSRIEAGRAQASYAPTDLARFTAELASNFSTACEKAGLALRVDCPPLPRPVYVDRGMWEKVVLNLLSNAFKFTFEGAIEVAIRAGENGAELRVRDSGVGIGAQELPRIFERFHRVEGARARTHEGSGIGLAFVRELVHLHGGEIAVASEPGRGSSFTVRLPFGAAHLPQERVVASNAVGTPTGAAAYVEEALGWLGAHADLEDETPVVSPADEHILVVDDNADMRDYVARLLRNRWQVSTASDGAHALELIARQRFDLVITDVMMPRLDGFGLLQAIRSQPAGADLPVVLLSARAGDESRVDGMTAGADDYIVKPFTAQQLIAQVSAQLTIGRVRRKSAEERERQRDQLYALFMQAPNPIVILAGPDYVVELANPELCTVWNRRHEELVGRALHDVLPELRGQGFKELLDAVRASGVAYNGRETPAKLRNADGSWRTVYFNFVYTPLRDADGAIGRILVNAFDVTDQVVAREQTSALRREAESANRAKDEFLAMLGHELRNPLAPIATAIQVMRLRGAEVPELGILERQTAHLARLVDDLLDVSRITRGKIELRKRPVEIGDAVLRAMEMASPLLEQRGQRVSIEGVPGRGLAVPADPERLAQVVFNLLSNAAKYSERGSLIVLRAWRETERVRLSVRDQGAGIAPDMIRHVFDMFVQQRQTLERSQGGLGLGLTIVRSLVELHGGRVWAKSAGLGQGSEFFIELPETPVVLPLSHGGERATARPRADRPRRILVVDDNVDAGTALADLVRALGHEVELAHDGLTALVAARRFDPEMALIDIGLPLMDGYELAGRLREQNPALRLAAVTGYGLERDRERSFAAGFSDHLVKPVDLAVLQNLLDSQRAAASPAENETGQPRL